MHHLVCNFISCCGRWCRQWHSIGFQLLISWRPTSPEYVSGVENGALGVLNLLF